MTPPHTHTHTQPKCPDGPMAGQVYYDNQCMKAVNQSIGRAIRHSKDYAAIVLLDVRYGKPGIHKKLPTWIGSGLTVHPTFGPAFAAIRKVGGGLGVPYMNWSPLCLTSSLLTKRKSDIVDNNNKQLCLHLHYY